MTRRERLERKLAKRKEWAEKAEQRATQRFTAADQATAGIEPGQPILVGHHSERRHRKALERSDTNMRKAFEEKDLAKHHESKADGLEGQLLGSIYSDDADAIEALESRIAEREAEKDRWKAYNASCRKGAPNLELLDEHQRKKILSIARCAGYQLGKTGSAPAYVLSNLNGNIRNDRERVKAIKFRASQQARAEAAGGVIIKEYDSGYASVTFAEKPDRAIRDELKAANFSWSRLGSWSGKSEHLPESVRKMANNTKAGDA